MKSPRPRGQPPKKAKDRLSVRITFNLKPHEALALEKYLKQRPSETVRSIILERVARIELATSNLEGLRSPD